MSHSFLISDHTEYRFHNLSHFRFGNCSVIIKIIQSESPLIRQWVMTHEWWRHNLHSSLSSNFPRDVIDRAWRNSSNSMLPSPLSSKTLKTNLITMTSLWLIWRNCYLLSKCTWIPGWKELIVYFRKFASGQSASWAIFHESFMPMFYFNRCNWI